MLDKGDIQVYLLMGGAISMPLGLMIAILNPLFGVVVFCIGALSFLASFIIFNQMEPMRTINQNIRELIAEEPTESDYDFVHFHKNSEDD